MKIGVLSDTHLTRVTKDLERIMNDLFGDVDLVIHAGDMVSLPVYRFLQQRPIEAVQGNMDDWALRKELPEKKILTLGDFKIGLRHGWGSPLGLEERLQREFSGLNAVIYGHSHLAANHWSSGIFFFNPGAFSGYRGKPSVGILHLMADIRGEIIEL
ncbi:MAG: metallophosphoesterase family protein [Deltaproteobacteria bacterium]|nr:metallophosphoesterase family protein [Deltaproteobacteria bacterium]